MTYSIADEPNRTMPELVSHQFTQHLLWCTNVILS